MKPAGQPRFEAIPAIAPDPRASRTSFERWHPTRHNLEFNGAVVRELIGIPYYDEQAMPDTADYLVIIDFDDLDGPAGVPPASRA